MIPSGITLYIVRHGQTEFNAEKRIAGQKDSRLTELGREQARKNGHLLRELVGDMSQLTFISSPLHRAATTMELLLEAAGLPLSTYRTDHRLMERTYGDWNGKTSAEIKQLDPVGAELRHKDWWTYRAPGGGECGMDVHDRVRRFVETLTNDTLVVSHALPSIMMRGLNLNLGPDEIRELYQPNAGIIRLQNGSETRFGD